MAAENTELYVVKDLWCPGTVELLITQIRNVLKYLWCSSTVWLLKTKDKSVVMVLWCSSTINLAAKNRYKSGKRSVVL